MGVQLTARTSFCCRTDQRGLTFQQSQGLSTPAKNLFQVLAISNIRSNGKSKNFQSPVPAFHSAIDSMSSYNEFLSNTKVARATLDTDVFGLLPEYARLVNGLDGLVHALAHPEVLDGLATGRDAAKVVNQTIATE
jgi:hypothetical protein